MSRIPRRHQSDGAAFGERRGRRRRRRGTRRDAPFLSVPACSLNDRFERRDRDSTRHARAVTTGGAWRRGHGVDAVGLDVAPEDSELTAGGASSGCGAMACRCGKPRIAANLSTSRWTSQIPATLSATSGGAYESPPGTRVRHDRVNRTEPESVPRKTPEASLGATVGRRAGHPETCRSICSLRRWRRPTAWCRPSRQNAGRYGRVRSARFRDSSTSCPKCAVARSPACRRLTKVLRDAESERETLKTSSPARASPPGGRVRSRRSPAAGAQVPWRHTAKPPAGPDVGPRIATGDGSKPGSEVQRSSGTAATDGSGAEGQA
jgi:hypothetical protein